MLASMTDQLWREDSLRNALVGGCKDGGQILDEMRSVASLLQLLDYTDHNVIVDAISVDLASDSNITR